jgi:hypothetical protein
MRFIVEGAREQEEEEEAWDRSSRCNFTTIKD